MAVSISLFPRIGQRLAAVFSYTVPDQIRDDLTMVQYNRLIAILPTLYLTITITSIAAAFAVKDSTTVAEQALWPALLIICCAYGYFRWRRRPRELSIEIANRVLARMPILAGIMGTISGIWCWRAYEQSAKWACAMPAVFIALAALMSANFIASVPRAAKVTLVTSILPIIITCLLYPHYSVRSVGVMLFILPTLQLGLIYSKFRETIQMLTLQHELTTLAETDPLTQLGNRRVFTAQLADTLARTEGAVIAMIDLDGFKIANDRYGHAAGDSVLIEIGRRLQLLFSSTARIARLGGDEFAILFGEHDDVNAVEVIKNAIGLPILFDDRVIFIGASVGMARAPVDGATVSTLMYAADHRLYADKAMSRSHENIAA